MHSDFDTWQISYFKDKDGFEYEYDYNLFILAKVLRPGYADEFYRSRIILIN